MKMTTLETAVLNALLAGNHPVLATMREQLKHASVKSRDYTGVGFYTEFSVPTEVERASALERLVFGDVHATVPGLEAGVGFVLYIEQGLLHVLEGYTFDEPWPQEVQSFSLAYSEPTRSGVLSRLG